MAVTLERDVPYFGFEQNLRLTNGEVELIIPTEFGPRIMRYALLGKDNLFAEISPSAQRKATPYGDDWHIYGGHRLWYAPEQADGSYYPDNHAVSAEPLPHGVRIRQRVEPHSGLEKTLEVELAERGSRVTVRHLLRNAGEQVHELAPWALSAMAPGGRAIFPQVPYAPHPDVLAPARPLVVWPFTRMRDPRFTWGDRYIQLQQDPTVATPNKVGMYDPLGYMAYALSGQLFLKQHQPKPGVHADFGCNVETFTNELFLELETLGPVVTLAPGASVAHPERWQLFDRFAPSFDEDDLTRSLAPLLARSLGPTD
jgi:hypothetical protein